MPKKREAYTATQTALLFLFSHSEAAANEVGEAVWPDRSVHTGRGVAHGGGGYGRLKKAGLVEHAPSEGSSRWRITRKGMDVVHEFNR